jgi:hypothetical protein
MNKVAAQVARNPPNDVVNCPRLRRRLGRLKLGDAGKNILQVAHLPNPPPPQVNSPPVVFPHRDDPTAAAADISVTRRRGIRFACRKIIVGDPVLGVPNNAAAPCPLGADDLLALPRDHHVAPMTKPG